MKKNRGITLVALIVTIIVLLILAGVIIIIFYRENGILKQVKKAKKESEISVVKELARLEYNSIYTNDMMKSQTEIISEVVSKLNEEGYATIPDTTVMGFSISEENIELVPLTETEGDKTKDIIISLITSRENSQNSGYLVTINGDQHKMSMNNGEITIEEEPIQGKIEAETYKLKIIPKNIVTNGSVILYVNGENITEEITIDITSIATIRLNSTATQILDLTDALSVDLQNNSGNSIEESKTIKVEVAKVYDCTIDSKSYKQFLKENGELDLPTIFYKDNKKYKITSIYIQNQTDVKGLVIPESVNQLRYDACWNTNIEYIIYKGEIYYRDIDFYDNSNGLGYRQAFNNTPMHVKKITLTKSYITSFELIDENGVLEINSYIKVGKSQYLINEISTGTLNNTTAKKMIIGDGIKIIKEASYGTGNLYKNTQLETIEFGKDVIIDAASNLYSNTKLQSIMVDEENIHYKTIDGILYNKDVTTLISVPVGVDINHLIIPNSVTILEKNCLRNCENITELTLPDNLQSTGSYTFYGMTNLKIVHYKNNVYTKYQDLENALKQNGVEYNYYTCLSNTGLK